MAKIILVLSLVLQLIYVQNIFAEEYRNSKAGFKVNLPKQEVNIMGADFYGGLQPNGDFVYVQSLDKKQASELLEQEFTGITFNNDYAAIKLLERSGIDPKKSELKLLEPTLYWPSDKPFIKPLPTNIEFEAKTQKIKGHKSIHIGFIEAESNEKKQKKYSCSIDLLCVHERLYIITTKTLLTNPLEQKTNTKNSENSNRNIYEDYIKGISIVQSQLNTKQHLLYNDKIGEFNISLPDNWYYVQSYFSDDPKACLTFALPMETLQKIKEETRNLETEDLEKDKIANNVSEERVTSWVDLITEGIWSVSCETRDFTDPYLNLKNQEATKSEIQLLFSELKRYIESSRYYNNAKFDFDISITPRIGYINFDFDFNLNEKKDFDNSGRIFFTKKKAGIIVYTSTLGDSNLQKPNSILKNIKSLDLK